MINRIPSNLLKALTGSRKRKAYSYQLSGETQKRSTASYWDEGSKNYYLVYDLKTGNKIVPPVGSYPMFQAEYELKVGEVLIRYGVCSGKPSTPTVYYFAADEKQVTELFF